MISNQLHLGQNIPSMSIKVSKIVIIHQTYLFIKILILIRRNNYKIPRSETKIVVDIVYFFQKFKF